MTIGPGARVGPYEVMALIGEGGMGRVWRAHHTVLGRDDALKVLPDAFMADPDRLARFQREAQVLASLNHPSIAQLHGLEQSGGVRALVMELVEGPTLADRLATGPLPLDEALHIGRQIADALEVAHDHGVIHRDLKPANVKVRADGAVKVLDFGLAKALDPVAASGVSMSPTITSPAMTHAGVILGTAAYMSPEQARGKPVDRRADIWAFGCVLFEMLSGQRPFPAEETVSDTIAGVLKGEPAWEVMPAGTPSRVRTLLERCLRKDVRRRLAHIGEARIALEETDVDMVPAVAPPQSARSRAAVLWAAIAISCAVAAAVLGWRLLFAPAPEAVAARFDVAAPAGALPMAAALGMVIDAGEPISPDGRTVLFVATFEGQPTVWLRAVDSPTLRPLPQTKETGRPVWSPDSQSIAFLAEGRLKRTAIAGGPATPLVNSTARDLAWGSQNIILIGGDQGKPLLRVPAEGGDAVPATTLAPGETSHDYPHFLPDGRHFLYMARRGPNAEDWDVYLTSLGSNDRRLVRGIHAAARYSPTGHLLFGQDFVLMAVPFDVSRPELTGEPMAVAQLLATWPRAVFGVSRNGTLAYLTEAPAPESQLAWFDRNGTQAPASGPPGRYNRVRLSRNGGRIAFDNARDIFFLDLDRGLTSRLVSRAGADFAPVFSPDGETVAFGSSREPATNAGADNISAGHLYTKAVGAAGDGDILFKSDAGKRPTDWSRDGRYLAYTSRDDIWALAMPPAAGAQPVQVTNTAFAESEARFSPDGRWIAYQSNESAAGDVHVQSFPDGGRRYTVSAGGGSAPRWSIDGRMLFYVSPDLRLMSVSVARADNGLTIGAPVPLFQSRAFQGQADYDVAADGRFLLKVPRDEQQESSIAVVVNWAATMTPR